MSAPFDKVSFLAASRNRVDILEAVSAKPLTRADIQRATDTTRATLGRILADLLDRDLICREGTYYEATPLGSFLVRAFNSLVETVDAVERFGPLLKWFPVDDITFELGCLRDARITRPSRRDALKPVNRSLSLLNEASEIRLIAAQHAAPAVEAIWEAIVVEERATLELVISEAVVETILSGDPDRIWFREMVKSEQAEIFRTTRTPGYNVGTLDGIVTFGISDDQGAPQGLIETDEPTVRSWFTDFFRTVKCEATPVSIDGLPD